MENKPDKGKFLLDKARLVPGGGLDVSFTVEEQRGDVVYLEKYHICSTKDLHPDLTGLFKRLKPMLANVYGLQAVERLSRRSAFAADDAQKRLMEDCWRGLLENVWVTGITLTGKDDKAAARLEGTFYDADGGAVPMKTRRIRFAGENYGFEAALMGIAAKLEEEVYAFLFEGKVGEMEEIGYDEGDGGC